MVLRSPKRAAGAALLAAIAVSLGGCRTKEAPPAPEEDRTLAKLKEEVDRHNRGLGGRPSPHEPEDPNARLAGLAAQDPAPRELPLPAGNETVHADTLALKLAGLTAAHSVKSGRLELTSADVFLAVKLLVQNVGNKDVPVDLRAAFLTDGDRMFAVASDVQRAAGTRELSRAWKVDAREEITLYFEVPRGVVGEGLELVIPAAAHAANKDVTLPLD